MNDEGTGRNGSRAVRIWLNPASDYTAEVIHPVEPQAEVAEEAERLLAMLAELARARQFVALANEREPHPVRARHSLKALRQIERQMVAELEELYGRPVEIDPPRTDAPSNGAGEVPEDQRRHQAPRPARPRRPHPVVPDRNDRLDP
jgi:hypothetical protein